MKSVEKKRKQKSLVTIYKSIRFLRNKTKLSFHCFSIEFTFGDKIFWFSPRFSFICIVNKTRKYGIINIHLSTVSNTHPV